MIEGLKLTMTGVQLRANIDERIRWHQKEIARFATLQKTQAARASDHAMSRAGLERAVSEAERRIDLLMFIRDYLVANEVYRLGEFDLRFADLLPDDEPFDCECFDARREGRERAVPALLPEPHEPRA